MHNAHVVDVTDRVQQPPHDGLGLELVVAALRLDAVVQVAALEQLHHDVHDLPLLEHVVHVDDVRVVQQLQDADLQPQALLIAHVHPALVDHLHRVLALRAVFGAGVHVREPADAFICIGCGQKIGGNRLNLWEMGK